MWTSSPHIGVSRRNLLNAMLGEYLTLHEPRTTSVLIESSTITDQPKHTVNLDWASSCLGFVLYPKEASCNFA